MPLTPTPQLPSAIPPQDTGIERAWMILGQEYVHRLQLQGVVLERAVESNDLHDAVIALTKRQEELLAELEQHRQDLANANAQTEAMAAAAEERINSLAADLEHAREESAAYVDEISALRARLSKNTKRKEAA